MGQDTGEVRSQQLTDDEKSPEQLRSEIEEVRADLGDTAAALAAKTDFKARARAKADEVKNDLRAKVGRDGGGESGRSSAAAKQLKVKAEENPVLVAAGVALVGGFALGRVTRR